MAASHARDSATMDTTDRELIFTRVLDAPRELAFQAWTDPHHLAHWWGPDGFTLTTREMDVRPGGVWRFIMHGPDGTDYKNRIVYTEVSPPGRLVYKHAGEDDDEPVSFEVTVTFEEHAGKSHLTMHMLFPSKEELERVVRTYGADEGARQTLGRLAQYVADIARRGWRN